MSQSLVNQFIHVMWSTKDPQIILEPYIKQEVHKYLIWFMKKDHVRVFEIGGGNDHVHILLKLPPMVALSKLIGTIKSYSTKWLKNVKEQNLQFSWQNGYGGYTVSNNTVDGLRQYIRTQEEHHQKVSPQEGWKQFLVSMGNREPLRG